MARTSDKALRTYEEYSVEAMLLGLFYYGQLHVYLPPYWVTDRSMHPDTHEWMDPHETEEHIKHYREYHFWLETPEEGDEELERYHAFQKSRGK